MPDKNWHVIGFILLFTFLLSDVHPAFARPKENKNYDVAVVGAGTGGAAAAIQAARMGWKVALIEETDWIGGQMTAAGVANMDRGTEELDNSGIYGEFISKIKDYYHPFPFNDKPLNVCYWSKNSQCFEPAVGQIVLKDMLRQAGVDIYLRKKAVSISKSGNTVIGVTTQDGTFYNSKVLIDATEYGDVIPLTGARYRVGNLTSDNPAVSDPNTSVCIQDITYSAVVKKYPTGVPQNLRLSAAPPGYNESVKQKFAEYVSKEGNHFGYKQQGGYNFPFIWSAHNGYRGFPDSSNPDNYQFTSWETNNTDLDSAKITKTGINLANDYPVNIRFIQDNQYRKDQTCQAKLKTLQFLYYLQDPQGLNESSWAIADDQGYDSAYNNEENLCTSIPSEFKAIEKLMPVIPYVRESRRIIGLHTLTAGEIKRVGVVPTPFVGRVLFASAVALGDYADDLHGCTENNDLEQDLENINDVPTSWTVGVFQIPFESFIPETIDGFVAAEKNISQTRLVNGATRLQPSTMLAGQAAGVIAGLSVQYNIQPRELNPFYVQDYLSRNHYRISQNSYSDMPATDIFWPSVQVVDANKFMQSVSAGLFGKSDNVTRRMIAGYIVNTFKLPVVSPAVTPVFADISRSDPDAGKIEAIYTANIVSGCSTNPRRYCPDDFVTRAQMAVYLVQALGIVVPVPTGNPIFTDVPADYWAYKHIQFINTLGIASGCSSNPMKYCPDDLITKAEISALLLNTYKIKFQLKINNSTPSPVPPITQTPGDINTDGKVDGNDYSIIVNNLWLNGTSGFITSDIIQDGEVNIFDYNVVMRNFGK